MTVEGYKHFIDAQSMSAFDVNAFLMSQAVTRFDTAADRDTALEQVVTEGMVSYNKDTGELQLYDGSAWQTVAIGAIGAAGSDGQIQYNNGGSFGGASSLSYNDANGDLSIGQRLILSNSYATGDPKITLYDNGSATYGFAISSQDLDYLTDYNHRFYTGSGAGSLGNERFTILQNGNVGIGTTSPSRKLIVSGSGFDGGSADFISTNSGNGLLVTGVDGAGINDSAYLVLRDQNTSAFIGLTGTAAGAGDMRFSVNGERMRIDSSGNVGIGRTNPATKFHVNGAVTISSNTGLGNTHFPFTDGRFYYTADPETGGTGDHVFRHFSGGSYVEQMRILENGNVGINDSTPTYRLDVNGTGRFTGTLYFGSLAGSRIYAGTNGANDTITMVSDETYVYGQSVQIDTDLLDFRIGPVSTMKMSNRQVYWGYTGNQGLGSANTIVGTNFGIAYEFDNSSGGLSVGTGWYTILNAYALPVVTGGKRWGTSNSFTCWVLWGFSAYSTNVSTKYTKVVANSSTIDYETSEQYFFYNTTFQHQGWSFFDTISTFRQDLGNINFQVQVRSASGSINFDANDYKWIWVFRI